MANSVSGAYSAWNFDVYPEDAALLKIATAIGVNYVPLAVATQVGAGGTNYVWAPRKIKKTVDLGMILAIIG